MDVTLMEDLQPNFRVFEEIIKQAKGKPRNALNELQKAIAAGKFTRMETSFEEIMRNIRERFEEIRKDAERGRIQMTKDR